MLNLNVQIAQQQQPTKQEPTCKISAQLYNPSVFPLSGVCFCTAIATKKRKFLRGSYWVQDLIQESDTKHLRRQFWYFDMYTVQTLSFLTALRHFNLSAVVVLVSSHLSRI
ncbi:hypothetical protein P3L10_028482 [Capsicum annuum]